MAAALLASGGGAGGIAISSFNYNRANYNFDTTIRWNRFIAGRTFEIKRFGMYREDVSDLTGVPIAKMAVYAPFMTIVLGYCITVLIEGRSGLKFPAPPTFISGVYIQCLCCGFAYSILATWLVFHSALRAQVAAVQLRTRIVRLPVPTQWMLDNARRLGSGFEEARVYDMLRVPYAMPHLNIGDPAHDAAADSSNSDEELEPGHKSKNHKSTKKKHTDKGGKDGRKKRIKAPTSMRAPGWEGAPAWVHREFDQRKELPNAGANAVEPLDQDHSPEHFELIRNAQREWWCAETYCRILMLYAFMHLIIAFAYWLVIHCIAELLLLWVAVVCSATLSSGVCLMFRLDVIPDHGGQFPFEIFGPMYSSIVLMLQYTATPTPFIINISRGAAVFINLCHVILTFRLYGIARPDNLWFPGKALEMGGSRANMSGALELPTWLPTSFQHVLYLVAPPKPEGKDEEAREAAGTEGGRVYKKEDPLINVNMQPWHATRFMLLFMIVWWLILLAGRFVEVTMGERMLMTNPGTPPWDRIGHWEGFEFGPVSSKHYAHVTPQKGHFYWQPGRGPLGGRPWPSDRFGYHPEADMHWRRLRATQDASAVKPAVKPVVPVAVAWPALLEPEILACETKESGGRIAGLSASGFGAVLPSSALGSTAQVAEHIALEGLPELGSALGASWGEDGNLLIVVTSGDVVTCGVGEAAWTCRARLVPQLPLPDTAGTPAVVFDAGNAAPLVAAIISSSTSVMILELRGTTWERVGEAVLPDGMLSSLVSVNLARDHLLGMASDGSVFWWSLQGGQPMFTESVTPTVAGMSRAWQSACALPDRKVIRLAQRTSHVSATDGESEVEIRPEILI